VAYLPRLVGVDVAYLPRFGWRCCGT
jgi:hypothetical protein